MSRDAGVVASLVAGMLPTKEEQLLLRAVLLDGQAARAAWDQWLDSVGDPVEFWRRDRHGIKRLHPALHDSARRNGLALAGTVADVLRASTLREELRSRTWQAAAAGVLAALGAGGVDYAILPGASLVGRGYESWIQRHCHDLDLLTDPRAAADALAAAGFQRVAERSFLTEKEGLPVELHAALLPPPLHSRGLAGVEAVEEIVGGRVLPVLRAAEELLYVLVQTLRWRSRRTLRWVVDAVAILNRGAIDWPRFAMLATESRVAPGVLPLLVWLRDSVDAAIPAEVFAELTAQSEGGIDHSLAATIVLGAREEGGGRAAMRRLEGPAQRLWYAWKLLRLRD